MGVGSRQWETQTHTHTVPILIPRLELAMANTYTHAYTNTVPRDMQVGRSIGLGSEAILTHVGVAGELIKLMGYEYWEDAVGMGEQAMANTHTHTHTHTLSLVIHRVDGAP